MLLIGSIFAKGHWTNDTRYHTASWSRYEDIRPLHKLNQNLLWAGSTDTQPWRSKGWRSRNLWRTLSIAAGLQVQLQQWPATLTADSLSKYSCIRHNITHSSRATAVASNTDSRFSIKVFLHQTQHHTSKSRRATAVASNTDSRFSIKVFLHQTQHHTFT